jgi:hypothetical protein
MPQADFVPGQHGVSDDLLQRPVGGDAVEAGDLLELHAGGIDPDAGDTGLAADHDLRRRSLDHDRHVARPVGGAEQHDLGPDEAGIDGDQMIGQIGHQRLRPGGPAGGDARRQDREQQRHGGEPPALWSQVASQRSTGTVME